MIVVSVNYVLLDAEIATGVFVTPLYPTDMAQLSDTLDFVVTTGLTSEAVALDTLATLVTIPEFTDNFTGADVFYTLFLISATDTAKSSDSLYIGVEPGLLDYAPVSDSIVVAFDNHLATTGQVGDVLINTISVTFYDNLTTFDIIGIKVNDAVAFEYFITKTDTAGVSDSGEIFHESYVEGHDYFAERYVGDLIYF